MEDLDLNLPASIEPCQIRTEILKATDSEKERPSIFSLLALELQKQNGSGLKCLNREKLYGPIYDRVCSETDAPALPTEEVMNVARPRFIKLFPQRSGVLDSHPNDVILFTPTDEDNKNKELLQLLLDSAEKISNQQYDDASALLDKCGNLSSITGNPVKRVVHYFVLALRVRIDRETGRIASGGLEHQLNIEEAIRTPNPTVVAIFQEMPFKQLAYFTGIQSIVDNVVKAKKIHVIDLDIATGVQWSVLMQALVAQHECPFELLKITVLETTISKLRVQKIRKRLMDFAKTINLALSFKTVMVSDFKDLKKDVFEVESDEVLVVYSAFFLKSFLNKLDCLESLMNVIKTLQPCVMVVTEVEANHNSEAFMERFREALSFYSAIFDSIEACMDPLNPNRISVEAVYLNYMIRTIVASESEQRTIRHEKIGYWRAIFARFGMVETDLSASSLYQANLVVKMFPCWSSCTLTMDGKCLITGWKGIPILSVSVWKFQ